MLELLARQQDQRVKIIFTDGEEVICKPLQYLEEDEETYLVQVLESSKSYVKGDYIEVEEQDIKTVNKASRQPHNYLNEDPVQK